MKFLVEPGNFLTIFTFFYLKKAVSCDPGKKLDKIPTNAQDVTTERSVISYCLDYRQRLVLDGEHFVPNGMDPCTECVCVDGEAQLCVASVCSLPQDCRDVRKLLTDECCKYVCFDRKWRNLHYDLTRNYSGDITGPRFRDNYQIPYNGLGVDTKGGDVDKFGDSHSNTYTLRLGFTTMTTVFILICLMFSMHRLRSRRMRALLLARPPPTNSHPSGSEISDDVDRPSRLCQNSECDGNCNDRIHWFAPPPPYKATPSRRDLPPAYEEVVLSMPSESLISSQNRNATGSANTTVLMIQDQQRNLHLSPRSPPPESV